ncbi:alpha/beta hydrolase [Azospirillum sp. RWY-5-1]|uniref:Alpha/beta hydrolase n=1 Tax=Azospirillum oleiclasticum TaxID=2735135 RepID=A0ABX2TB64_9PROT|nr:alpha/beta hydrolase [Azospirillum oleiclasticum]NYZ14085.1 alpha/beta hydrolase [Azospirillum oleiclasticum]NYZ21569.1 alpha/beta hydrolase [Azospirillum oleiclasticum]
MNRITEPGFIRTDDGASLFFRDWAPQRGDGGPVVFVSSWSLPSDSWAYQMLALTEAGLRCVAYDRRGHGRSSDTALRPADGGCGFDRLADDLAAVLEALDLRNVTLVGHSMGPGEIVRYLTRHGTRRVARVVMIGTITPMLARGDDNPDGVLPAYFDQFQTEQLARDFPKWLEDNIRPFVTPDTSPSMMEWVKAMALQASLRTLLDCHRAIAAADFRQELRSITVPALIIHGDQDVTSPVALAHRTAALMPDARLSIFEGAPHGLFLTHMDRLNRELLDFARGC